MVDLVAPKVVRSVVAEDAGCCKCRAVLIEWLCGGDCGRCLACRVFRFSVAAVSCRGLSVLVVGFFA